MYFVDAFGSGTYGAQSCGAAELRVCGDARVEMRKVARITRVQRPFILENGAPNTRILINGLEMQISGSCAAVDSSVSVSVFVLTPVGI